LKLSSLFPGRRGGDDAIPLLDDRALQRAGGGSPPAPSGTETAGASRASGSSHGPGSRPGGRVGPPPADLPKPSAMQSPEDRYGYAVAALLLAAGILFAVSTAKGKHPSVAFPLAGSAVGVALAAIIYQFRNRFAAGITAVVGALLVNTAKPATNLVFVFYLVLLGPLAWAIWLTLRQSKAAKAVAASQPRLSPEERRARRRARKRGEEVPAPVRPVPDRNRRYTPPKADRKRRSRKELAASATQTAKKDGGRRRQK
jgi:hypothetical protein